MAKLHTLNYWVSWASARGYHYSPSEETEFISSLSAAPAVTDKRARKSLTDRQLMSLVLTMLRDGSSMEDMAAAAPNLEASDVVYAHTMIAEQLVSANQAWENIVADPASFEDNRMEAYRVLPHVVNHIAEHPQGHHAALVGQLNRKVQETTVQINQVEDKMCSTGDIAEKINLHYSLARADSRLWDDGFFLPSRPGQLTPTRLSFVLGEV